MLVCGASSGLGRHFAALLAELPARVALAARRIDRLAGPVASIEAVAGGRRAHVVGRDRRRQRAPTMDDLGDWGPPDVVINNAGVTVTRTLLAQTEADCDLVLGTNLKGCWLINYRGGAADGRGGSGGSIVNIASIWAGGWLAASRLCHIQAGVVQATKAMALELARHRIRVNALLPGYVETDLNRDFLRQAGEKMRQRFVERWRAGRPGRPVAAAWPQTPALPCPAPSWRSTAPPMSSL
ncbi:MAG: SDR family NAD(P)-dependent oxidoreductase [Burkholderiaceae bacterium]